MAMKFPTVRTIVVYTATSNAQRLELAGFSEEERVRIRGAAPASSYEIEVGWYVVRKSGP